MEVTSREKEEAVLAAIGDSVSCRILLTLDTAPRPAHELVHNLDLPQSTVYHKLHDLQEKGLVTVQAVAITGDGKRVELFRSLLEACTVDLREGRLNVRVRYRNIEAERIGNMWENIRTEARR
jgi:DNA-binding transcriptional ArsR family regulator